MELKNIFSVTQTEHVVIAAPLNTVWNFIEDPNNLLLWNPKVRRVTALSDAGKEIGTIFGILYVMNNKADEMLGTIALRVPMSRITFRYSGGKMPPDNFVEEGFVLAQRNNGVLVERTITFTVSAIPLWARFVMWIIFKIGKPDGESYLTTLKSLIERS